MAYSEHVTFVDNGEGVYTVDTEAMDFEHIKNVLKTLE